MYQGTVAAFLFLSLLSIELIGQEKTKIKILNADEGEYTSERRVLRGNVKFKHKKTLMFCDSALLGANAEELEAYGNVKIIDKKGTEIKSDSLFYSSETRLGRIRSNVLLSSEDQTLSTGHLDFDMENDLAYYVGGGVITNSTDNSTLFSKRGTYFMNTEEFHFKDSIVMNTPDYNIVCDTMQYNSEKDITRFVGPTTISSDSNSIYCERGWYDKKRRKSEFVQNVELVSKSQILKTDSLRYNQAKSIGRAYGSVSIADTTNKINVLSDYAEYDEKDSTSLATGRLYVRKFFNDDTLHLHADTLITNTDKSSGKRIIKAFHNARFFKSDLQGKADSMVFNDVDSTITMYNDPVVWSEASQLTGDTVVITNADGEIRDMVIQQNAYVISKEDSISYDQIKGKRLIAWFKDNEIYKIDVNRNGETVYFVDEEDENQGKRKMGMNYLQCSNMSIFIDSNNIDNIRFYNKPEGTFYPIKDVTEEMRYLRYFQWRSAERPRDIREIFPFEMWQKLPNSYLSD
ncbi:MAG TPA: hypothetical protein DDX92_13240 [Flavobacteriales bacterium]|jgi:lipopolysaccharide transport protein LptA|nr:hypothetical protein [Flavobacteriales bacterium]